MGKRVQQSGYGYSHMELAGFLIRLLAAIEVAHDRHTIKVRSSKHSREIYVLQGSYNLVFAADHCCVERRDSRSLNCTTLW